MALIYCNAVYIKSTLEGVYVHSLCRPCILYTTLVIWVTSHMNISRSLSLQILHPPKVLLGGTVIKERKNGNDDHFVVRHVYSAIPHARGWATRFGTALCSPPPTKPLSTACRAEHDHAAQGWLVVPAIDDIDLCVLRVHEHHSIVPLRHVRHHGFRA